MGMRAKWEKFKLPSDMTNKSFCELGCWNGGLCVEAVSRKASRVVGVDPCVCDELKDNVRKYNFEFHQMDMGSEKFIGLGQFDVVSNCGLLYHVENPLSNIFRTRSIVKDGGLLVMETMVSWLHPNTSHMMFFPNEQSRWWAPNERCLKDMLVLAGFREITEIWRDKRNPSHGRLCLQARALKPINHTKTAPRSKNFMEHSGNPNPRK